MANGHGGKRTPSRPAPVSGPGRLSKRTDGGPTIQDIPSQSYGDASQFKALEQSAPLSPPSSSTPPAGGSSSPMDITPLSAPSTRPNEPVTAGAPMGAGPGLESLGLSNPDEQVRQQDAQQLAQYLPVLEYVANLPGSTPSMRAMVRRIKGMLA